LLVVVTVSLTAPDMMAFDAREPIASAAEWLSEACGVLVYPLLLVGRDFHGGELLLLVPGLTFATVALAIAFWSVNRRDIPLEAAQ
jgi:hypothetical protein